MTTTRVITKQLITEEDIELGFGEVTQTRNGKSYTLNKVSFAKQVPSIADLPPVVIGNTVHFNGYHPGSNVGGGTGVGKVARHNGVTNFDVARLPEFGTAAYYVDSGVDADCWVRTGVDVLSVYMAGAVGDNIADDSDPIQACITIAGRRKVYFPRGDYRVTKKISIFSNHFDIQGNRRGSYIRASQSDWVFEYAQNNPARWCNFSDLNIIDETHVCLGAFRGVSLWESNIERIGCQGFSYTTDINDPYAGAAAIQIETGGFGSYWNKIDSLTVSGGLNVGVRLIAAALGTNAITISNCTFLSGADQDQNPASHPGYSPNTQGKFNKGFGVVANNAAGNVVDCNAIRIVDSSFEKLKEAINWQVFGSQMMNLRLEKNNIDVQHNTSKEITGTGENNADGAYDQIRVPVMPTSGDFGGRGAYVDSDVVVDSLDSSDVKTLALFENVSAFLGAKQTRYKLDITLDCETIDNGRSLGTAVYSIIDILVNGVYKESFRVNVIDYLSVAFQTRRDTINLTMPLQVSSANGSIEVRIKAGFATSKAKVNRTRIMLTTMHTFDRSITVTAP